MPLPARKRPRPGIMLGRELIFGVGGTSPWSPLRPGATVSLIIPNGTGGTVGRVQAEISDTVGTGVIEIDRYQSWLPLPLAQRLTAMDGRLPTSEGRTEISGLRLMVEPGIGLEAMQDQLRDTLALRTQNWMQRRGNLVKSQEVFRNILVFVMLCVQLVCIFIIYAVFSTLVAEKRHDIGVLLGLGASPRAITATFLLAGQIACVLGGIVGWALGWGILAGINPFGEATGIVLFPQDVFYAPSAPISWNPLLPALFLSVSMIVGLFATAIPAWRAGRIDPIDTLRSAG
jgi:lipoprotein-releasing system permease protein